MVKTLQLTSSIYYHSYFLTLVPWISSWSIYSHISDLCGYWRTTSGCWQGPLEAVKSKFSAQSSCSQGWYPGLCLVQLWISSKVDTPKSLRVTCFTVSLHPSEKVFSCVFLFLRGIFCFRFCPLPLVLPQSCDCRKESGSFFFPSHHNYQVFINKTIFS